MRILHLEDDPKDTELIQSTLEAEGISCEITCVDNTTAFRTSLERGAFDLVLLITRCPLLMVCLR